MKRPILTVLALFVSQIVLAVWGTDIFQKEANPFALLAISVALTAVCFKILSQPRQPAAPSNTSAVSPWLHALVGIFGLFTAYEELRKLWVKFAPDKISDVIPQLKAQCDRFFAGDFPYQLVKFPQHEAFPVYMPLHWMPVQISSAANIDPRWSGMILLMLAVGAAGFWLAKTHVWAAWKSTLSAMLLFALPVWGYVLWSGLELAAGLESVVAAWYVLLAAGLASRNHVLIAVGLVGAVLSRYTLLFWLPLFAVLLWLHAPRKYSFWIWGSVAASVLFLFVVPFLLKDPSIPSKVKAYYDGCSANSWLRPDEYTYLAGLSFNIHLRHWLPGNPEDNLPYAHFPQIGIQLLLVAFGIYFYQKKWRHRMDVYTFSLLALSIMPMLFYLFSPMLFQYYMLMPLSVSAVLCWKAAAVWEN